MFAGAIHGAVGGYWTMARIGGRSGQPSLVATVGLSLALMEYLRIAQGTATVWFPRSGPRAGRSCARPISSSASRPCRLLTTAIGLSAGGAVLRLMRRSGFGRAWRAYADDPRAAALFGVDGRAPPHPHACPQPAALAGLSGALVVLQYGGLGFAGGFGLGLKALVAAVVGGVGSVAGAFLGGLAIGLFETVWSHADADRRP